MTAAQTGRSWGAAAAWAAWCSALFCAVYTACNWWTTRRADVGTWYAAWEMRIPLVPWTIVPYWSIDGFFVAAFFAARTREDVALLGRRITAAIVVAGAGFLLVPLRPGFDRSPVDGWAGAWFDLLRGFDQPHNLFPSLHVALLTILAAHYRTLLPRARLVRAAAWTWVALVGVSPLTTHQHQAVDVVGGFALGAACLYAFPGAVERTGPARNPRAAALYGAGAALLAVLAATTGRWGAAWLWPAASMALLAAAYAGWGAAVYRKGGGLVPFATRVVLGPVLLGQWLSWCWYTTRSRPWDEVAPGVLLGRRLTAREAEDAVRGGVAAVLDLTVEFSAPPAFRGVTYLHVPVLDLTAPTPDQLRLCTEFIDRHRPRGPVYVHCKAGYSRSATVVGAWLLSSGTARTADEAAEKLRAARPGVVLRPEVRAALTAWAA